MSSTLYDSNNDHWTQCLLLAFRVRLHLVFKRWNRECKICMAPVPREQDAIQCRTRRLKSTDSHLFSQIISSRNNCVLSKIVQYMKWLAALIRYWSIGWGLTLRFAQRNIGMYHEIRCSSCVTGRMMNKAQNLSIECKDYIIFFHQQRQISECKCCNSLAS